jgi:hypothetical protein
MRYLTRTIILLACVLTSGLTPAQLSVADGGHAPLTSSRLVVFEAFMRST